VTAPREVTAETLTDEVDGTALASFVHGRTGDSWRLPFYGTILEMLADGWAMLGPPIDESWTNEDGKRFTQYGRWLTRTAKAGAK